MNYSGFESFFFPDYMNPTQKNFKMKTTRKQKINRLLTTIKSKEEGINSEELIAKVCYQSGVARRTCLEYLGILLRNNLILKEDEKYIASKEQQTNL